MTIAHRRGFWWIKAELEECLFRLRQPEHYRAIRSIVGSRRKNREAIRAVTELIESALKNHRIDAKVGGRAKRIVSIHRKLERTNVSLDDIYDIRALRVIVDNIPACYAALSVIHRICPPMPGEVDDYIACPKSNGYRSLHTAVLDRVGRPCEIQIRTREMHRTAEMGSAAHWRYKESGAYSLFEPDILSLEPDSVSPIPLEVMAGEVEEVVR
jgi:GTP pyrophosphokinase